jgi:hypothetical protein
MNMVNQDATKTEHRDALLSELLKITSFNSKMPIPAYLRGDPSLFFEAFEHFKKSPMVAQTMLDTPAAQAAVAAQAGEAATAAQAAVAAQTAAVVAVPHFEPPDFIKVTNPTTSTFSFG